MFEMLSGYRLEFGNHLVLNEAKTEWRSIPVIDNPNVPGEANEILKKCLAYNPKNRFANGGEIEWQIRKIIPRRQ